MARPRVVQPEKPPAVRSFPAIGLCKSSGNKRIKSRDNRGVFDDMWLVPEKGKMQRHYGKHFLVRFCWAATLAGLLAIGAGLQTAQAGSPSAVPSEPLGAQDTRFHLRLAPAEQTRFLAGMREMLGSVQGIIEGIGTENRELIAQSAKASGNRMARATPASEREKLPPSFKALGAPTHLLFEEIAVRAETDDMASLSRLMAKTMNQCMACHAAFTVR